MKFNVGIADRVIRVLLGIAGIIAGLVTKQNVWPILGGVLLLTAFVGFCPI